jgi:hypothetical protein
VVSSEANVSVLKPWPDEDQPCIGGGGPFLPPDGMFCPTEANGSLDVDSVWVWVVALACSSCCRSEEDPTLEMVICLSFEEGAPVPAPNARAEGSTRLAKCEKRALFQVVTTLLQCTGPSAGREGIGKLRLTSAIASAPSKHAKRRFRGVRPAPYPDLTWPLEVHRALLQP